MAATAQLDAGGSLGVTGRQKSISNTAEDAGVRDAGTHFQGYKFPYLVCDAS